MVAHLGHRLAMSELAATSAATLPLCWPRHTIFPERACAKDSKQAVERVPQSSIPAGSTRAGSAGLNAEQIAFRSCTGIYSYCGMTVVCLGEYGTGPARHRIR